MTQLLFSYFTFKMIQMISKVKSINYHHNILFSFRILTPPLKFIGAVCVQFYYHMKGDHIGKLELFTTLDTGVNASASWVKQGEQGPDWILGQHTLQLPSANHKVIKIKGFKVKVYKLVVVIQLPVINSLVII